MVSSKLKVRDLKTSDLYQKESIVSQLQEQINRLQPLRQNLKTEQIELKSEKGVNYTKLRDLLAAGKWKEADQETALVMLQAANRVCEGYLTAHSINDFPCQDLHTIDQLWVDYSKGYFGLSVQKNIYNNLGGTREENKGIWYKFFYCVGWRKEGRWLYNLDLTFESLDTVPVGYLPFSPVELFEIDDDNLLDYLRNIYGEDSWATMKINLLNLLFSQMDKCEISRANN